MPMNDTNTPTARTPCDQCAWRVANHGKRHPGGFYRKDNLRRLWNQIRKGGRLQSCHPTDRDTPTTASTPARSQG